MSIESCVWCHDKCESKDGLHLGSEHFDEDNKFYCAHCLGKLLEFLHQQWANAN